MIKEPTLEKLQATASTLRELYGLQGTKDLIITLEKTVTCPEGICDGSGRVHKMGWSEDAHRECDDEGDEDCLCVKDN
ncbi:MAG TPA: hypothetical protein ENI63_00855 [Candidatus Kaiserbacteria bacterium]|nr:hypothetical protein [Candidatus Kaiserbacteria bacterium]